MKGKQHDIEDSLYDEIPTIKLNVEYEEFTVNLKNYKQEKMENQEGDLSMFKALIFINPEAASIQALHPN